MGKTKKKTPNVKGSYTEESLQEALAELKSGRSLGVVSDKYNIPKTTLSYKKRGITKPTKVRRGPECILGDEEENNLVSWISYMSDLGFPITKLQLLNTVKGLLKELGKKAAFKNGIPGRHWYEGFKTRHPDVCERLSQNLLYTRATLTEKMIRAWFKRVEDQLEKYNVQGIGPSRIFNCDESAFYLSPKGEKVLVKTGEKVAYNIVRNDDKECLTVLFCGNAAGQLLQPMILFNYVKIPRSISITMPKGFDIGHTESGWQTAESFYEWVANCFLKWLKANRIQFPVILYVDGHVSHMTRELSNFCRDHDIVLVALHPNATHIIQPMDVAFFHPLKKIWSTTIRTWRVEHCGERLQREYFGGLMKEALDNLNQKEILISGFRATGLYPFSPDAVKYEKFFKKPQSSDPATLVGQKPTELSYLKYIESQIDAGELALFKSTGVDGDWAGPDRLEGLYQFWRRVQGKQNAEQQNEHITGGCGSDQARDEEQQAHDDRNARMKTQHDNSSNDPHVISFEIEEEPKSVSHSSTLNSNTPDDGVFIYTVSEGGELILTEKSLISAMNDEAPVSNIDDYLVVGDEIITKNIDRVGEGLLLNEQSVEDEVKDNEDVSSPKNGRMFVEPEQESLPVRQIPLSVTEEEQLPHCSGGILKSPVTTCPLPNIPFSYRNSYLYPIEKKMLKKKGKMKELAPCVVSSDDFRDYHDKKDEAKRKQEQDILIRKNEKLQNRLKKAEKAILRREAQEMKREQREKELEEMRLKKEQKKAEREMKQLRMQEEKKQKVLKKMLKKPPLVAKAMKKEMLIDDNDVETPVTGEIDEEPSVINSNDNELNEEDENGENSTADIIVLPVTPKKRKIEKERDEKLQEKMVTRSYQ